MNKKDFLKLIVLCSIFIWAVSFSSVEAVNHSVPNTDTPTRDSSIRPSSSGNLTNPLGKNRDFSTLVGSVADIAFKIGFTLAVIFIIYSGLKFVMARGNPEELEKAKENLKYVLIGTGILLGASVIAKVIQATIKQLGS